VHIVTIRVAGFTPLRETWKHPSREITRGIHIVDRPVFEESDWTFWNLGRTEETEALERSHGLRVEEECEYHERDRVVERIQNTLRSAMLAFQLWAPKGRDGLAILSEVRDGLHVERVTFAEPYPMSQWGKMINTQTLNPDQLVPMVEGTLAAFESQSVPLINPFQFLEIGLQTAFNHMIAGALFWTFGLDGLLGNAGGREVFCARLNRLLGADTLIFPEDWAGRRPVYKVGEVCRDIFAFRDQLSHGQIILQKHRKQIDFKFEPPELAYLGIEKWALRRNVNE
jgi:hypothetical protein